MGDQGYSIGGRIVPGTDWLKDCKRYVLSDNVWSDMAAPNYYHGDYSGMGSGAIDGYIAGGPKAPDQRRCEKYDISGNSWITKPDMPFIGTMGRCRPEPVGGWIYASDMRYAYASDIWGAYLHSLYNVGYTGQCFGLISGKWGGLQESYDNGNTEMFDPDSQSWTLKTAQPSQRTERGTGASDGIYGFIVGGQPGSYTYSSNYNRRYDPASDVWADRAACGTSSESNMSFVISGMMHVMSGHCYPNQTRDYNGRFDDASNSWTSKASFQRAFAICFYPLPNLPPNAPSSLSVSVT